MEGFVRGVRLLSKLCGYVAAAMIGCSVIVVCEMVFVRYALNMNTIWQTDFVTYSLVAATFIGSPYVLMLRGHVNVDVLPHYVSARRRRWLALFASVCRLPCVTLAVPLSVLAGSRGQSGLDTMWRRALWIPMPRCRSASAS
jgi:TRAP-type C4-dicarboxylate transport system permease small subunit